MLGNPMMGAYLIGMVIMGISWLIGKQLRDRFARYSKTQLRNNMSGAEIAEKMLRDNGISNVKVISVKGQLTDHYDPTNRTVNLSDAVYNARNAAACRSACTSVSMVGNAKQACTSSKFCIAMGSMGPFGWSVPCQFLGHRSVDGRDRSILTHYALQHYYAAGGIRRK